MIEVKLQFTSPEELIAFFSQQGNKLAAAIAPTEPETTKRTRAPKTESAKEAPAATPSTAAEPAAQPEKADSSELTYEKDIQPAFLKLFQTKGRDIAIGIIKQFGFSSKISEATPDQYPEVLAAIQEAAK